MADFNEEVIDRIIKEAQQRNADAQGGNKKCFLIGEYALLDSTWIIPEELENIIRIGKELEDKGINVVKTLAYKIMDGDKTGYILQERAQGEELHNWIKWNIPEERLPEERQKHINKLSSLAQERQELFDKFVSDWLNIYQSGLKVDPSKPSNFFYEKGKGISFIDLDANDGDNPSLETTCGRMLIVLSGYVKNRILGMDKEFMSKVNSNYAKIFAKFAKAMEKQGMQTNEVLSIIDDRFGHLGIDLEEIQMLISTDGQGIDNETAELSEAKKIIARRLERGRTEQSENDYRQMVMDEPSGVILELVTNINQLSQQDREMALQIKTKSEQGENVDDLTEQKRDLHKMYSSYVDILSDFILKHQTDSKYIDDILEQMPFLDRANFINHSQRNMTSKGVYGGKHVEITNVRDVFERNIDIEVRKRLQSQSFEDVAGELYNVVESVEHPRLTRRPGPKYNCINFALYRIDEELGKGLYEKELSKLNFGGKTERERIASVYGYGRDIYEQHLPPQASDLDSIGDSDYHRRYVDTLYWAQKITTEDKVRLALSEINGVTAEMRKDLTQQKETTLSFGL